MFKRGFAGFMVLHGLVHIMGFIKAFGLMDVPSLTLPITPALGLVWLVTALLFMGTAVATLRGRDIWLPLGVVAVCASQMVIFTVWQDAKFGTWANLIILAVWMVDLGRFRIWRRFRTCVEHQFSQNNPLTDDPLTESDLAHLPLPVQRYIRLSGFVGRPKVVNFRVECRGGIRSNPGEGYMKLNSVQFNFLSRPARLFHIVARKKGIPAAGLHLYQEEKAIFQIKLLNWFTVVDAAGEKMDQGETVTLFNDMCFMAPGTLIDERISWQSIDEERVRAVYTNGRISVRATLHFSPDGRLVNFVSTDRFETDGRTYHNYPWSTPVRDYHDFNGYLLPSKASLVYARPDGDFTYGEFELIKFEYNLKGIR
jgi:hypothetical protein